MTLIEGIIDYGFRQVLRELCLGLIKVVEVVAAADRRFAGLYEVSSVHCRELCIAQPLDSTIKQLSRRYLSLDEWPRPQSSIPNRGAKSS
ncbi:MAG: hypothetical protein ACK52U_10020 [Synechococcaceae cyanobacterium]